MGRYLCRRILLMAPTLLIVTFLVFILLFLSPGDPVLMLVPVDEVAQLTDDEMDHLRQKLGLDRPLYVQYADWLHHVLQGDLGRSIHKRRAVSELLAARFPVTLELAILSVLTATIGGGADRRLYGGTTGRHRRFHRQYRRAHGCFRAEFLGCLIAHHPVRSAIALVARRWICTNH